MMRTCPMCGREEGFDSETAEFVCPGCGTATGIETFADVQRAGAVSKLQVPALGLIVSGAWALVNCLFVSLIVLYEIFFAHRTISQGIDAILEPSHLPMLLTASLSPLVGPLLIIGGRNMRTLKSRRWAMTAAFASFVPTSVMLLSAPFGIWSLIVLTWPSVTAAFSKD